MEIVIIGTGGMAKELWGMLTDMGETVAGFVAEGGDNLDDFFKRQICGLPIIGIDSSFVSERPACDVVIANGNPRVRRKIRDYYQGSAHRFPHFIHPDAVIFSDGKLILGDGSTLMPGGVIQPDVKVGRCVHINMGVTIGHDCEIGDYCVINHNAGISGNVRIGAGVLIGAGATIIEGNSIGDGATVGAGAVATKDVPAGETWVGVPARKLEKPATLPEKLPMTLAEAYGIED